MGNFFLYFLPALFGSEEYREAWHRPARTWSFPLRFCGRLIFKFTLKFFLTKRYREALAAGYVYFTLKSALCILLTTIISFLAAYGFLGTRWFVKPFAFFLTFPVAWFLVIFPALNWGGSRWIGFPKAILPGWNQHPGQSSNNG